MTISQNRSQAVAQQEHSFIFSILDEVVIVTPVIHEISNQRQDAVLELHMRSYSPRNRKKNSDDC